MKFAKVVLKPEFFCGIEAAYSAVEKMNSELYKKVEDSQNSQQSCAFLEKILVGAVVITVLNDGRKVLCFCGDEDEERRINGVTFMVKKRYLLPVDEIVEFINSTSFNVGFVSQLEAIYDTRFKPQPVAENFVKEFLRNKSFKEILGSQLFHILIKGFGSIQRRKEPFSSSVNAGDEPYQMLCQKALDYMNRESISAFAS